MENLENFIDFVRRHASLELLILLLLVTGTFLLFSFFIQDLLKDYFKDYREKSSRGIEGDRNPEKKPKLKARQRKNIRKPRLVKTSGDKKTAKDQEKTRTPHKPKGRKSPGEKK